ncbi:MAG: ArsR/SmtB family transcription factor [Nocardioidaceae bacterium]
MSTRAMSPPSRSVRTAEQDCCDSSVTGAVLDVGRAEALALVFKALSDPTRVRLVSLIAAHTGAEACVCELMEPVGLSQPTVSHHLKQLVEAGLLSREQRGRWAYYRVEDQALDQLAAAVTRPGAGRTI